MLTNPPRATSKVARTARAAVARAAAARAAAVLSLAVLVLISVVMATGCRTSSGEAGRLVTRGATAGAPRIVVTYPVLGAAVAELVGDAATVEVLMPPGIDPHDYRPSARDIEAVQHADFVVANGLGLEEGLADALEQAAGRGVPVFYATDHIAVRRFGAGEPGSEGAGTREAGGSDHPAGEHLAAGEDPHFWVDPISMADAMQALAGGLHDALGLDLTSRSSDLQRRLDDLDVRARDMLSVIPRDRRLLVTGHESLGYFARRYGFRVVGAVVSSPSSQAAPSAADLAALKNQIQRLGVQAIFNEIGTPRALSSTLAEETGVRVIELATHTLPEDGSYETFIIDLVSGVVSGLEPLR